jgi:hypothetical protein
MKLIDAIRDARLFAHPFGDEIWRVWRTFLAALFAETPRESDFERYREATGRRHWPMKPFTEAWLVIGRRGGKSQIAVLSSRSTSRASAITPKCSQPASGGRSASSQRISARQEMSSATSAGCSGQCRCSKR